MKKCFPFLKTCGSQLEYVDKRHSNLIYVPDEVMRNARSIEECFLDANQIKDLPKNFFRLSKLRVLTLSDNDLSYIPESIGNFSHLVELDISRNHIEDIHYNIKFCNELRTLDLSSNPISRLPEGFSSLRNLTSLSLNDISLTELPNDFGNLSLLVKLELRDNCLKVLPNSFSRLQLLELIDLGGNEFQEFPKQLGLLSQLKVLCMDNNELQNLPQEIGTLRNLQQLDVSENFLDVICQEIGNLALLTDFVLSQNSLDSIPNSIGNLKELTTMKLDQNKLVALTSHIGNCTNLQELYLTENLLTKLPGTLGKLSKLSHLNVDRNNLLAIPAELTKCNSLAIMSFRDNHIKRLPEEIGNMLTLHVLDVSLNQLDRLPLSIAQCPLKALWLSENQSQSIVKLQRDSDDSTGEEFLTCYLLPQSGIGEDMNQDNIINTADYKNGDRLSQDLSTAAGDNDVFNVRVLSSTSVSDSKVRFTDDEQVPSNRLSKELPKTRHPKFDKKAVDGHIIPKDIHTTKEIKFAPTRMGSETEQPDLKLNGKDVPKRTKKISETSNKSSGAESSEDTDVQTPSNDKETYEYPHSLKRPAPPSMAPNLSIHLTDHMGNMTEEARLRSHSDAGIRPVENSTIVEEEASEKPCSESQSQQSSFSDNSTKPFQENSALINDKLDFEVGPTDAKSRKMKHTLQFDDKTHDSYDPKRTIPLDLSDSKICSKQGQVTCAEDESDSIVQRVGFAEDVQDSEDAVDPKLTRKDTPHYTKQARIKEMTVDGVRNEDVVKQLIEKMKLPPPTSPHNTKNNMPLISDWDQGVQIRPMDTMQLIPTYDQVVSASALARGSDVPPGLNSATSESEETNVVIQKLAGEPLGMSIAGGKGCSPYQPVFVSRITDTGAANRCGLRVNDKILDVNGQSMKDVDHGVAVAALKNAGNYIDILVQRDVVVAPPPLSSSCTTSDSHLTIQDQNSDEQINVKFENIKCELVRDENGLGFSIAGGKGSMKKDNGDQRWAFLESIYICKITANGAADKCQMLQVGDKVVKINGIDVSDARHDQAVVLLSGSESTIHLEVQRQVILPKTPVDFTDNSRDISKSFSPDELSLGAGPSREKECVRIVKAGGQLGLSICGGSDHYSHPFGLDEPGIFVSKIAQNGAAKSCGKLRIGDRIVSVNDNDITKATHEQAIVYIIQAANELILEIIHETPPAGLRKLSVVKEISEKLGINVNGGSEGTCMNPDDHRDKGIFITKVLPGSAVHRDGRLKVGDRLIEVNGRSFMGVTCASANKVLREVSTHMEVLVCDGVHPELIARALVSANNLSTAGPDSEDLSPSYGSPGLKQSPNNFRQSPHINTYNSTSFSPRSASDNTHENDSNNYTSSNQQIISSPQSEDQNLSFRSKRRFFEKEIGNRKN